MTLQRTGRLAIPEASRYMQRLCYHFSKKIAVQYDAQQGHARFDWGECRMQADDAAIVFACSAPTPQDLARVQHVIDEHVKLFARKAPVAVAWEAAG